MKEVRKSLLVLCIAAVGLSATAGSIAFIVWSWPRLPASDLPGATRAEKAADVALVSLLALNHLVFHACPLSRWLHARLGGCQRSAYAFLRGVLLVALAVFWVPWGGPGLAHSAVLLWLARAAFTLGILLHLLATAALGNAALLGYDALLRRIQGSPPLPIWANERIVVAGPFASTRHPDALALMVLFLSGAFFQKERLLLAVGACLWILATALAKERRRLAFLGPAWAEHRRRTGFLLPRRPA